MKPNVALVQLFSVWNGHLGAKSSDRQGRGSGGKREGIKE